MTSNAFLAPLQPLFATAFSVGATPVSWIEVAAFVVSLGAVALNIRVNVWAWPLAIVSSLLTFALLWNERLYGNASLQIFFAAMAVWGWWQWLRGTRADGTALAVATLGPRGRGLGLAALTVAWPAAALFLSHQTDTDAAWPDAFATTASVLGQWLLGRKYVENWPVWIAVNVVSVALFAYKGLGLFVLLYAIFIVMAVLGWRAWRALLPQAEPA